MNEQHGVGRLVVRPGKPDATGEPGLHPLGLEAGRDGFLYVPGGYRAEEPAPLLVVLHGAGGHGRRSLTSMLPLADAAGLLLLAPDARQGTWDIIVNRHYGPDIAFLDRALAQTFARVAVEPSRVAIVGFSDGASYALSVGITNGDLFRAIIAFSPGFMAPGEQEGTPRIFVSHGTRDEVLPIARCSRRLVPTLQRAGYAVLYQEFDGPHTVPPEIAQAAVDWFLAG